MDGGLKGEGEGAQAEHLAESVPVAGPHVVRSEKAPQQPCCQRDLNHGHPLRPEVADPSLAEVPIQRFRDEEKSL